MAANDTSSPSESQQTTSFHGGQQVRRALKLILVAYTLVAILLGFFQRKLLYHPVTASQLPVAADRQLMSLYPAAKDVRLKCADGTSIGAWLLLKNDSTPVQQSAADNLPNQQRRPLILYFHGNAMNRASRSPWYQIFAAVDADVLAIDYHGYGDSEGKITEGGLYQDCDAAWAYATSELKYAPSEIIIAGTSLGGAAAVYTAYQQKDADQQPAALFVTATFSSMVDVAGSLYPWLPVGALLVDRYPSAERIPEVKCPIVVLHGDQDQLVSPKFGKTLFDAAATESPSGQAKRWIPLEGVGHQGLVRLAGDQIQQALKTVVDNMTLHR